LTAQSLVEVFTRKSRQLKQTNVKINYGALMAMNIYVLVS